MPVGFCENIELAGFAHHARHSDLSSGAGCVNQWSRLARDVHSPGSEPKHHRNMSPDCAHLPIFLRQCLPSKMMKQISFPGTRSSALRNPFPFSLLSDLSMFQLEKKVSTFLKHKNSCSGAGGMAVGKRTYCSDSEF